MHLLASKLVVLAASSLTLALPAYAPHERYSFGGSNQLAAQVSLGAPADVFLSANTRIPAQLHAKGLVGKPIVFTHNELVLIVPRSNPARIQHIADLQRAGIKLVVAAAGVPAGDYTRAVLTRLHLIGVLRRAVSQESDVREVVAKVALGEADAGFVYATDARSVRGKVATIAIPPRAQPSVAYAGAVIEASTHKAAALAFIRGLLTPAGQSLLRRYGFR